MISDIESMRTLIDIPDVQLRALAALCERTRQPRAAVVREAIAEYLARHQGSVRDDAFGLWGPEGPDGLAFQERARAEW